MRTRIVVSWGCLLIAFFSFLSSRVQVRARYVEGRPLDNATLCQHLRKHALDEVSDVVPEHPQKLPRCVTAEDVLGARTIVGASATHDAA